MKYKSTKFYLKSTLLLILLICMPKLAISQEVHETPKYFEGSQFTFEDLVNLIRTKKITTIESLLPQLPMSLRSNFTLIYESSSLQKASYSSPRALMFQPDGKLACTFIENPKFEGNDSLECYQFRTDTSTFDFREIKFPTEKNGYKEVEISASNMTVDKSISCKLCHGQNPRPNWEGYDKWRGVFGSFDDSYFNDRIMTDEDKLQLQKEIDNLLKFKKSLPRSSRYSKLIFNSQFPKSQFYPYSEEFKSIDYRFRPNARFNEVVMTLTAKRNAAMLLKRVLKESAQFVNLVKCQETNDGITSKNLLDFLQARFSAFEWSPYFRSYRDGCTRCGKEGNVDLDPNQYDYTDGSKNFAMNSLTADEIISKYVSLGLIKAKLTKIDVSHYTNSKYLSEDTSGFWQNYPAMISNLYPMKTVNSWDEPKVCELIQNLLK